MDRSQPIVTRDDSDRALQPGGGGAPPPWYLSAIAAVLLNVMAGLLVAAILIFADTASRVLLTLVVLGVLVAVGSCILLALRNQKLSADVRDLRASLSQCENRFAQQTARVGIAEITDTMADSRWSPDAVMDRAAQEVRFLGVFGHKWVMDAQRQERFRAMLARVQLNGGRVQFLLLDPSSESATRLAALRKLSADEYRNFHSIEFYKPLMREFTSFQVRLFDHFPFQRLLFVDGLCAVSRFKVNAGAEETLKAPQLVFASEQPGGPWTLYQTCILLYDYLWERAHAPSLPTAPVGVQAVKSATLETTNPPSPKKEDKC